MVLARSKEERAVGNCLMGLEMKGFWRWMVVIVSRTIMGRYLRSPNSTIKSG